MSEMHVAIICACLPVGKPFLRKHFPKVLGSSNATPIPSRKQSFHSSHFRRFPLNHRVPSRDDDEIRLSDLCVDHRDGESNTSSKDLVKQDTNNISLER
jgi:hypothetical protein